MQPVKPSDWQHYLAYLQLKVAAYNAKCPHMRTPAAKQASAAQNVMFYRKAAYTRCRSKAAANFQVRHASNYRLSEIYFESLAHTVRFYGPPLLRCYIWPEALEVEADGQLLGRRSEAATAAAALNLRGRMAEGWNIESGPTKFSAAARDSMRFLTDGRRRRIGSARQTHHYLNLLSLLLRASTLRRHRPGSVNRELVGAAGAPPMCDMCP